MNVPTLRPYFVESVVAAEEFERVPKNKSVRCGSRRAGLSSCCCCWEGGVLVLCAAASAEGMLHLPDLLVEHGSPRRIKSRVLSSICLQCAIQGSTDAPCPLEQRKGAQVLADRLLSLGIGLRHDEATTTGRGLGNAPPQWALGCREVTTQPRLPLEHIALAGHSILPQAPLSLPLHPRNPFEVSVLHCKATDLAPRKDSNGRI